MANEDAVRGTFAVEARIVKDPAGRPAVLLQLPKIVSCKHCQGGGYITMHDPVTVRQLAGLLIEESDTLETIINSLKAAEE